MFIFVIGDNENTLLQTEFQEKLQYIPFYLHVQYLCKSDNPQIIFSYYKQLKNKKETLNVRD